MSKKDTFFGQRFTEILEHWKRKKNSTQEEFAELVGVKSPNSISDWKKGTVPSPQNLKKICDIFEVDQSYFYPQTHDERYKYSSEYTSNEVAKTALDYCESIGLDLDFLRAVRKMFGSDFDELFPVWGPLAVKPYNMLLENPAYIHDIDRLSRSAPMTDHLNEVLQMNIKIERDEETETRLVTLGSADLDFLRDIQKEVKDFISFQFHKKNLQRKQEEEEASKACMTETKDGGRAFILLKADQLNAIDHNFKRYVDEKPTEDK